MYEQGVFASFIRSLRNCPHLVELALNDMMGITNEACDEMIHELRLLPSTMQLKTIQLEFDSVVFTKMMRLEKTLELMQTNRVKMLALFAVLAERSIHDIRQGRQGEFLTPDLLRRVVNHYMPSS
jgi:hypothetical protein